MKSIFLFISSKKWLGALMVISKAFIEFPLLLELLTIFITLGSVSTISSLSTPSALAKRSHSSSVIATLPVSLLLYWD